MRCKYCGKRCDTTECSVLPVAEQNGQKWWICKRCSKDLARKSREYRTSLRKSEW